MNLTSCGAAWTAKCTLTVALWLLALPNVALLVVLAASDILAHKTISWQSVILLTGVASALTFAARMTVHEALRTALVANFLKQMFIAQTFLVLGTIACHLRGRVEWVRRFVLPAAGFVSLGGVATLVVAVGKPNVNCFDNVWLLSGATSCALAGMCVAATVVIVQSVKKADVSVGFRKTRILHLLSVAGLLFLPALVEMLETIGMATVNTHDHSVSADDKCLWYLRTNASYSEAFCWQFFLFQVCVGVFPLWTVPLLLRLVAGSKARQESGARQHSIGLTHALSVDVAPLNRPLLQDGGDFVDTLSTADLLSDRWISSDSVASSAAEAVRRDFS